MKDANEIREYYNDYTRRQIKSGLNYRHYKILQDLIQSGLKRNHKVLEIGCGVGTLTGLIIKYLKKGKMVAADISDESIKIARERLKKYRNIDFVVSDMSDFEYNETFDFIILPDVLEHIPIEQHKRLFLNLDKHIHDDSIIFINIPHPKGIEFYEKNDPSKLQIIDQALHADEFLKSIYANGLILIDYKSYSLYHKEHDYILIKLKRNKDVVYTSLPLSKVIRRKLLCRMNLFFSRF
ncbi:MAG: class I SAM-dependent methyltransferase [Bacteroidota bacterium]